MRRAFHRVRLGIAALGLGLALLPAAVLAVEPETPAVSDRALDAGDFGLVMWLTLLLVVALLLLAALAYGYRERRGLYWQFQQPDPVVDDHH